jgi:hypothetical protein
MELSSEVALLLLRLLVICAIILTFASLYGVPELGLDNVMWATRQIEIIIAQIIIA